MTRQERLDALEAQQGSTAEDYLLDIAIIAYARHQTNNAGANETYVAFLDNGLRAFHKPFSGINTRVALDYGHHPDDVPFNECAAWRLAHRLGPPYSELVAPTVMREHHGEAGSLAADQHGDPRSVEPFQHAADACRAAAFFDSLIAQQDRHPGNYRWDSARSHLGLLDHGFAFALPGHRFNASFFVDWRWAQQTENLEANEVDALEMILDSGNLLGLDVILPDDRVERLARRTRTMRDRATILGLAEW